MTSPSRNLDDTSLENSVGEAVWSRRGEDASSLTVCTGATDGRQSCRSERGPFHHEGSPHWANGELGGAMKSADDCEVVVLPKGRGGAVCRMSADAYVDGLMSQNAVYSRSVLWPPMTGPTASWCDSSGTHHLLAFSILCTLRMNLEHWAFWDRIFAAQCRAYLPAARAGPPVIKPSGFD